jgi:hypothetical protein
MARRLSRAAQLLAPIAGVPWGQGAVVIELQDQLKHIGEAWQAATGTLFDVRAQCRARATPGDSIELVIEADRRPTRPGAASVPLDAAGTRRCAAGSASSVGRAHRPRVALCGTGGRRAGRSRSRTSSAQDPPGNLYDWSGATTGKGLPFEENEVVAGLATAPLGIPWIWREGSFRWNDQARGEIRDPIEIVPRVDVRLSPHELPWKLSRTTPQVYTVTLLHGASDTTRGTVTLQLPDGWPGVAAQRFTLTRPNQRVELRFSVNAPARVPPGTYAVSAIAEDAGGHRYEQGRVTISYPYIRARSYLTAAVARVTMLDLTLPSLKRVGYIRGAADQVPEALVSAGLPIEFIDGSVLGSLDLTPYDAIVVGPRAYETDSSLVNENGRLLDYARAGGLVIVQYQQYGFFFGAYAPFPLFVASRPPGSADRAVSTPQTAGGITTGLLGGHDRVTDEAAIVTLVDSLRTRSPGAESAGSR